VCRAKIPKCVFIAVAGSITFIKPNEMKTAALLSGLMPMVTLPDAGARLPPGYMQSPQSPTSRDCIVIALNGQFLGTWVTVVTGESGRKTG
jgi:hypothetical protein